MRSQLLHTLFHVYDLLYVEQQWKPGEKEFCLRAQYALPLRAKYPRLKTLVVCNRSRSNRNTPRVYATQMLVPI